MCSLAYVLTCQRALRAYMFMFQRVLRPYLFTCQCALRAHVITCLACREYLHTPRVNMPRVFMYSLPNVPCVLTCSRSNVPCALTGSHAKVFCMLACLRANVPCGLTLSFAIACSHSHMLACLPCSPALRDLKAYVPHLSTCLVYVLTYQRALRVYMFLEIATSIEDGI